MQILKEEIRNKILAVAEDMFYHKGFMETTTRSISNEVGISVSNLYLYYENKESIFSAVSDRFYNDFIKEIELFLDHNDRETKVDIKISELIQKTIISNQKRFVIIADRSQGTKYEQFKPQIINILQNHINLQVNKDLVLDPLITYILARNFMEGIIEIAKNFKDEVTLKNNLSTLVKYHMDGIQHLI